MTHSSRRALSARNSRGESKTGSLSSWATMPLRRSSSRNDVEGRDPKRGRAALPRGTVSGGTMSDHPGAPAPAPAPPAARRIPRIDTVHGDRRADDYFWLRGKDDPEVMAYLRAENAHTEAVMKPSAALVDTLYAEMLARIKEDDQTVPYRRGDYFYYSRTEQGKQYPILCRKRGSLDAKEEVYLDLNELAKGLKFLGLGSTAVSDDGNLFAYSIDTTGFRQFKLQITDLRTGKLLPDTAERITSLNWARDNQTLFYTTEDATTKRSNQLYRQRLGDKAE